MIGTTATPQLDSENPWPGLDSFQENGHAFFHGRAREAALLLEHVIDAPVTVLYGRSGLGKTSLLRAGLFPSLRDPPSQLSLTRSHFLPVYVRLDLEPGAAPLSRQLHQSVQDSVRAEAPDAKPPSDEESLWEYLHRADFELWSARNYPLTPAIVIDQFEELFTLGERVPDLIRAFRDDLGDLAENRIPADLAARIRKDEAVAKQFHLRSHNYRLLISLREDFLPELDEWRRIIPALGRSRMRLLPLQAGAAFDAVHKPASNLMTDALARRVVRIIAGEDLHRDRDTAWAAVDRPSHDLETSEVEPALLSLFCRELNEERKRRGRSRFDEQLVEDTKRDVLSNFYLSCVGDLPPRVAEFIESELITKKGFRNSFARDDAVPSRLTEDELARLIASRLVRLDDYHGAKRIELTHDVLTSVVREHRDQRLEDERRKAALEALAADVEQERRARLQAVAQHQAELKTEQQRRQAELDRAELRAARDRERAAREREETAKAHTAALRKRSRILRRVLAATAVIAVLALVAAVVAVGSSHQATKSRQQAQANLQTATAQKLITEAQSMLSGTQSGGDASAFQRVLAALSLVNDPGNEGALYSAVVHRASTRKIITGHTGPVNGVAFGPDGHRLASAGADGTVRLWDADTGQQIGAPLKGNADAVTGIAFSPDGRLLASAGADGMVRRWDADTGQPVGEPLRGGPGPVLGVAFSPDGHRLVSAGADGMVRRWDADTGQPVGEPLTGGTGDNRAATNVAFSRDGRLLASGGADGMVRRWDADTGQPVGEPLRGGPGPVLGVAFSPDGHRLASAGADGTVQLWNLDTGQPIGEPQKGHTDAVNGVAFSLDGHRLASASTDETMRIWDVNVIEREQLTGHNGQVTDVAFSRDGDRLASAGAAGTVRLWDPHTGQQMGEPLTGGTSDNRAATSVAFSPNGRLLASAGADGMVRRWDPGTGKPVGEPLTGGTGAVLDVAFSPDGRLLASAGADGMVRRWDPGTGKPVGEPLTGRTGDNKAATSVAFSPDGRLLASAGADGMVRLWNPDTGQPVGEPLNAGAGAVTGVAFSPDGHLLASAGNDRSVRLWNPETRQPVGKPLTGHASAVTGVAFSPDGHLLASASIDKTVRLWNPENGQSMGVIDATLTAGAVFGVAFSPDGHLLASASADKTVRLWPADASPEMLCDKLNANMSHKQWHDWVSKDIDYLKVCHDLPIAPD